MVLLICLRGQLLQPTKTQISSMQQFAFDLVSVLEMSAETELS